MTGNGSFRLREAVILLSAYLLTLHIGSDYKN